ncbi:MAG TPA: hypothetical protein PLM53_20550 [Spirochaetota bacterium]|nr:hypothetical protein [Spirochaetota bacterium]HPC43447.1 hypothetical protein [Spirochaetota bacterium]HPL18852.1 hypothetical protein [Spirochaetota bacterium]HQF10502.1 hypothetical protein [Spirochaetota bacterium]HQH99487.1 hypothetical protein [Spirochaetota bacterium]
MKKRSMVLIDRKFQLKLARRVIAISMAGFSLVIAFLVVSAIITNIGFFKSLDDLNGAIRVQNNIVGSFVEFARLVENAQLVLAANKIMVDHTRSIQIIHKYLDLLRNWALRNMIFLAFIMLVMIIQGVCFYFYMLRVTHRISGPAFVMNRYIDSILRGKEPVARELRPKDELKDLYNDIKKLGSAYLKEKEKNKKLRMRSRELKSKHMASD